MVSSMFPHRVTINFVPRSFRHFVPFISFPYTSSRVQCVRMERGSEGEGETKCKGTKQIGQNEWDEVNVGRNDRVPSFCIFEWKSVVS